jgi:alpha-L-rhamnosidase
MKKIAFLFSAGIMALTMMFSSAKSAGQNISPQWLSRVWQAKWVANPEGPGSDPAAFLFRRTIELDKKPDKFVVHVSADQRYHLYVNRVRVAYGPARGDVLNWRFETIDIAQWLKPGKNVISARVWSEGVTAPWAQMTAHTAFVMQGDGDNEIVVNTPFEWKVYHDMSWEPFPRPHTDIAGCVTGANERFTASLHPWGWMDAGFDDSKWETPIVVYDAVPTGLRGDGSSPWFLTPRTIPLMAEYQSRIPKVVRAKRADITPAFLEGKQPVTIPAKTKATFLLDNVVETNAYPELVTSGGAGSRIRFSYEESLYKEPDVQLDHLVKGNRNDIKKKGIRVNYKFDEFLPDGGKSRTFSPFWWRSFRFIQVDIQTENEPLVLEDIRTIETGYPFVARAKFESSDPSLDKIIEVGWRTARLCAGETYFDCPYYEQMQYGGDTRIQQIISYYMTGDDRLARNAIELFNDSRIPEGLTFSRYPSRMHQIIPPFSLLWIGMIRDHRYYFKEDGFSKKFTVATQGVLDWFEKRRLPNGLVGNLPWWNFVDWSWPNGVPPGTDSPGSSVVSLEYVIALKQAAELEDISGFPEDAKIHRATADAVSRAIMKTCWNAKRGIMADTPKQDVYSQHATILAVLGDVIPKEKQKTALLNAINDKTITQVTLQFRFFLNKAIDKVGLGDMYMKLLDPWRQMIAAGLTTFPETDIESRSDCHAWSASPTYELFAILVGIRPDAPEYARVRIAPHLSGLEWVKGEVPHPDGMIRAYIRKEKGRVVAEIELPPGVPGVFVWNGKETPLKPGKQTIKQ